jgi:hypothetical protein
MRQDSKLSPSTISAGVTLSYITFYTAFDKQKKKLIIGNIIDLIQCRRGYDWTLVELNKAISLSGLTTMLMSFLPTYKKQSKELLYLSMNMLWVHSIYSLYKFYGYKLSNIMKDTNIKKLSILLGSAGQIALCTGYWGYISNSQLILSGITFGISHFWTMEVDFKFQLQVRPYAYLPFPIALGSLYYLFTKK